MSKMESKELLAFVRGSGDMASVGFPTLGADTTEIRETIRITHQQREVIRLLVDALKARRGSQSAAVITACDEALAAAAPSLEK